MKNIYVLLSFALILTACQDQFQDLSKTLQPEKISPPINGDFYNPTWASTNKIFFLKQLNNEDFDHDYLFDPKSTTIMAELYSYNLDNHEWQKVPLNVNPVCHVEFAGPMLLLPNGNLGIATSCFPYAENNPTGWDSIREINPNTNESKMIFRNMMFPHWDIGAIGIFAYSPDMSELVQEDATGYLLNNQLYYVIPNKTVTQIVPSFGRAMGPSWSPYSRKIAFWGSEDKPNLKWTWDIVGRASEAWNLYTSTPEGNDVKLMLPSINDPRFIKWSPNGEIIAFQGKYKGVEGVWLFNPTSSEIIRVWDKWANFDWSPDGKKIIVIDWKEDQKNNFKVIEQHINILELP